MLEKALARERERHNYAASELGIAAQGITRAAKLLAGQYHLVITNVPYLTRNKQVDTLKNFCESRSPDARHELATAFVERCLEFCAVSGTTALVTPQNWLFLGAYEKLRKKLLLHREWNFVAKLGPVAFQDMNWWAANTQLISLTNAQAEPNHQIWGLDVSSTRIQAEKASFLRSSEEQRVNQATQLRNPDCRVALDETQKGPRLEAYAESLQGISTADYPRFGRCFWEFPCLFSGWQFQQSSVENTAAYGGREHVLWITMLFQEADKIGAAIRGRAAWGKQGVMVSQMRHL